jgi:hypothetical protein
MARKEEGAKTKPHEHEDQGASQRGKSDRATPVASDMPWSTGEEYEESSASETACKIVAHGSRIKEVQISRALDGEKSANAACLSTALDDAMNRTLADFRNKGMPEQAALLEVHAETKVLLASIDDVLSRDSAALVHNRAMCIRGAMLSLTGVVCLIFPILVMFDMLTEFLPAEFRSILAVGAQEESPFGALSR